MNAAKPRCSLVFAVVVAGCAQSMTVPGPDAGPAPDVGQDSTPDVELGGLDAGPPDVACTPRTDRLDLLLVVDDSGSMTEEQVSFALELPRFLNGLVTGVRPDGTTAEPVTDIHVGVVSTDMGVGGASVFTCEDRDGDDGILQTVTDASGCPSTHPPFLAFRGGDTNEFVARASCASSLGTSGCGFEQPLEAMLKALTPSTSSVIFEEGTTGHADGANLGFRRAGAALLVVVLTDEEDCSALDADVFNPESSRYPGPDLNLRCFHYPEAVHPVRRYVDGLLALEDHPSRIAFASIVGVPVDLVSSEGPADYEAILSDPRMQEYPDPENRSRLTPSCNVPGRGLAFPPRRFVDLSRQLDARGARTTLLSICQESFGLTDIAIAALAGTCD